MKTGFPLLGAAVAAALAVPFPALAQSDQSAPAPAQPAPAEQQAPADQQAREDDVQVAILDVLLSRGLIDQQQYDELLAMARAKVAGQANEISLIEGRLARITAPDVQLEGGKPGKLEFKSADGNWSMAINGYMQARYASRNTNGSSGDGSNFSIPRARLSLSGNSGGKNIKYKLEVDYSTQSNQDTDLDATEPSEQKDSRVKDAYIDYGVTENGSVRFGQFKFPFGREELISDSAGQLQEKSIASKAFAPGREPGAAWWGQGPDGLFEYEFATANGDGENEPNAADNPTLGTGDGLRYGGRFVWYPLGAMKYDTPAFQTLDGGSKLAIGVAYMINKDASFLNTVSVALPSGGTDTDTLGGELQWMTGPFSLLAEYYDRTTNPNGAPNQDDSGYTVQAGYFVDPRVWELVARFSVVDLTDDSLLGAAASKQEEKAIGVNRYIDGQNGKWMLDYVKLDNETFSNQDESLVRLQYQIKF